MILAWLLACLPSPDDPVPEPPGWGPPPAPVRTETKKVAGNSAQVVNHAVALVDYARGAGPTGLEIEGDRVHIAQARWEKGGREAEVFWLVFPSAFVDPAVVTDIEVDGIPCPVAGAPTAGTCAFRDNKLAYASPLGSKAPTAVTFRVPTPIAAREAEIRGSRPRVSAISAASLDIDGVAGPVISTQAIAARVGFSSVTANSVLRFRPLLLPSPLFVGVGTYRFEVEAAARDIEPWTLWAGEVVGLDHPMVEVTLDPEKFPRWARLTFRTTRNAHNIFGPQPVWADVVVTPPKQ